MPLSDIVPNSMPAKAAARRIAIVAEAPGTSERSYMTCAAGHAFASEWRDVQGMHVLACCPVCGDRVLTSTPRPLVGPSGKLLDSLLAQAGIDRSACFVGNCCQHQPPANDISRFAWDGLEMTHGLTQLMLDLERFDPHFVLCLGNTPLRALSGVRKRGVGDWRGSLWLAPFTLSTLRHVKCLATYHPAALLREPELTALVRFDLKRVVEEARTDELVLPVRRIDINLCKPELLARIAALRAEPRLTHLDIEGGCGAGPACIGFATDPFYAFIVPFYGVDGVSLWSEADEIELWEAVAGLLEDADVPKCIMNGLYEGFVLAWTLGIVVRNLVDDIMLAHFELYCEFEKALDFQASIYTKQPVWKLDHRLVDGRYVPFKDGRRATNAEWFTYNGTDCCVTAECHAAIMRQLKPQQLAHYRFNVELLTPLLYMQLRGIRYDYEASQQRRESVQKRIHAMQDRINRTATEARPALAAFYAALSSQHGQHAGDSAGGREGGVAALEHGGDAHGSVEGTEAALIPLLADAFCAARRFEKRAVEETTWQPMRWNGKRWVKVGKRIADHTQITGWKAMGEIEPSKEDAQSHPDAIWLKPHVKRVTRNVAVAVASFADVTRFVLDSKKDACRRALRILRDCRNGGALPAAARGELATLLGLSVKLNATNAGGDAQWLLYDCWKLPRQYAKEGNRSTDRLATDDEAIIKAWVASGKIGGKTAKADRRAIWFLTLRRLITFSKFLDARPDDDGRIRFGLNLVGTPTGRMAAYGSPTGSSDLNPQTITKRLRDLYLADEGCDMSQSDLDGSDSYSVAAYCAALGDRTMLDDNLARVKPAKVLALIYERGSVINQLSRDALKVECKKVDGEGWLYFACKRVLHGSNYGMGKVTMSNQILTDSYKLTGKPIYLDAATCERIQERAFFVRYPGVRRWHAWMERTLKETGSITTCDGFTRRFYGRKDDHSTLKEALAHTPQVITTHAIKMTLWRLWRDLENRRADGSLRIEPLLCVHDSILKQWRAEDREWARVKVPEWFANEMSVQGVAFTIPANSTVGPHWKQTEAL